MPRQFSELITLDVIAGHDLGIVRADPGQLEQILIDLCVNARDAMAVTNEARNFLATNFGSLPPIGFLGAGKRKSSPKRFRQ